MIFFIILCSSIISVCLTLLIQKARLQSFHSLAKSIIHDAEKKTIEIREKTLREQKELEHKQKLLLHEQANKQKLCDELYSVKLKELEIQAKELQKKEKQLTLHEREYALQKEKLLKLEQEASFAIEAIAQMSKNEAREKLHKELVQEAEKKGDALYKKIVDEAIAVAEQKAEEIILCATLRCASKQTPERFITKVRIEDSLKPRLIGKDGRNIKTFEETLGVTLNIDETEGYVFISSFDPQRRYLATLTLEELVREGKIHPTRIEQIAKKAQDEMQLSLQQLGKEAAKQLNISGLHGDILRTLGMLHFKTSLGQNILEHSIEVGMLMGMIAKELGLDEDKAKRIGLLHDIGKALSANEGASHALCGMQFVREKGESEDVANGVGSHHSEIAHSCPESRLCIACDTLSALRPYARKENKDAYFERVQELEKEAKNVTGVKRAFALNGGKELRIFLTHDVDSAEKTDEIVKIISQKIEAHPQLSKKVQITVVQEKKNQTVQLQKN